MRFDPNSSILAGRSTNALNADLARLQQAYIDLMAGGKAVTVAFAQGDGSQTVTYTAATIANLMMAIKLIQLQLGVITRARPPINPIF